MLIGACMVMILTLDTILSKPTENDASGSTCTFFNWTKCKKKNKVKSIFLNQYITSVSVVSTYVFSFFSSKKRFSFPFLMHFLFCYLQREWCGIVSVIMWSLLFCCKLVFNVDRTTRKYFNVNRVKPFKNIGLIYLQIF